MKSKRIAYLGLLTALAFVFSYVEFLMPISLGIPGVKLGLANLVIIVAIYTVGAKDAFFLSMVRILLVALTFGNMATVLYSFAGAVLSFLAMLLTKKTNLLSMKGVSILGGVTHNLGQIITAMILLETSKIFYYFPVLLVAGTVSGLGIGVLASMVTERVQKLIVT